MAEGSETLRELLQESGLSGCRERVQGNKFPHNLFQISPLVVRQRERGALPVQVKGEQRRQALGLEARVHFRENGGVSGGGNTMGLTELQYLLSDVLALEERQYGLFAANVEIELYQGCQAVLSKLTLKLDSERGRVFRGEGVLVPKVLDRGGQVCTLVEWEGDRRASTGQTDGVNYNWNNPFVNQTLSQLHLQLLHGILVELVLCTEFLERLACGLAVEYSQNLGNLVDIDGELVHWQ
mmetsp:Transcript_29878/g.41339  ORF Transcript_29878/g.41339 Transcript_29878/m.41339 type:complete len:239 (+) Transcript_29878:886-1602(+)